MKISYNWLQSYFSKKLPTPEKLADVLTMHSFEVEEIVTQGEGLENVVVGEVSEKKKHPNADRLNLVKIKVGSKKVLDIVCGAPNIEVGQKVPVALVGAELPGGFKIEKAKIRGEESSGMVCSEKEIGLAKESDGIMVLDKKTKVGTKIADALGLGDIIFDIDILPNRAHDCLSHIGIAKEVAALLNLKIKIKTSKKRKADSKQIDVKIKDSKLCKRYFGRLVKGVEVTQSPKWLSDKMRSMGQKSISNIVDATNYVMLETGQPLHAFDADKVDKGIIVRCSKAGEKMTTLDGQEVELSEGVLVIADAKDVLAIAGVKGGDKAIVDENTKNIILESANFDFTSIRKTSRAVGIRTDSSLRYENEISSELVSQGMDRVTDVILEVAGGKVVSQKDVYPKKNTLVTVEVHPDDVSKLLGIKIKDREVVGILKRLSFVVKKVKSKKGLLMVEVPVERLDISIKEDLIEEVARVYGLGRIKAELPNGMLIPPKRNDNFFYAEQVRDILVGLGFSEIYNYAFSKNGDVEVRNPAAKDKKFMRAELLHGLRERVKENTRYFKGVKLFEIGRIFPSEGETAALAGVVENGDFYEAKGVVETVIKKVGITDLYFQDHKDKTADIRIGNTSVGVIDHNGFEINFEMLVRLATEEREYNPISKYPSAMRDIAIFVPLRTKIVEVLDVIENTAGTLLADTDLFDIYEQPEEDRKSLAFHLVFQSHDQTLSDKEINDLMNKIFKAIEHDPHWEVRK